tara:strand:+ start:4988 stop:5929 length:942 start_codon:yes stop_codon:yes gene_type:complete
MDNTQVQEKQEVEVKPQEQEQLTLDIEVEEEEEEQQKTAQQEKDEELSDHRDDVKKRIDTLTWKAKEAERQKQAALDYAKKVKAENDKLTSKFNQTNEELNTQYGGKIESQLAEAKRAYKMAYEEGNTDAMADASALIAKLSVEEENVKKKKAEITQEKEANIEVKPKTVEEEIAQTQPQQQYYDEKALLWASKNKWFGKNKAMTLTIYDIHRTMTEEEGYDATSDEYYEEVDRRIREEFPQRFTAEGEYQEPEPKKGSASGTTRKNVQTVAPANRNVKNGRNTIRLTKSQVAIAKKLGVPLEEYAKHVKEPV